MHNHNREHPHPAVRVQCASGGLVWRRRQRQHGERAEEHGAGAQEVRVPHFRSVWVLYTDASDTHTHTYDQTSINIWSAASVSDSVEASAHSTGGDGQS